MNGRGRVDRAAAAGARSAGRIARSAAGAVAAQGLNAASSLVIQVIAARALGVHGFGRFTLVYSVLIALTALYSGWVGDSLVVFDRAVARVRAGLAGSICAWAVVAALVGLVSGVAIGVSWTATFEISALLVVWLLEETGRRIFVARRRYWALTGNDLVYNAVTLSAIAVVSGSGVDLSFETLLPCLIAGSAVAVLAGLVSLPRAETRFPRPEWASFREVASFGAWRSINVGIRPLGLLGARSLVAVAYGAAALSSVQAAWLLLAPAMVLVNGSGMFLLPFLRERASSAVRLRPADLRLPIALIAAGVVTWAAVAIALAPSLQGFLSHGSGPRFLVGRWVVLGWAAYALAVSVAMPIGMAVVAHKRPRPVLAAQLVETAVGLGLVAIACAFLPYRAVPYALALGVVAGALVLYRTASRVLTGRLPSSDGAPTATPGFAVPPADVLEHGGS